MIFKKSLLIILIQLIVIQPFMAMVPIAQAADTAPSTPTYGDQNCFSTFVQENSQPAVTIPDITLTTGSIPDADGNVTPDQLDIPAATQSSKVDLSINLTAYKSNPLYLPTAIDTVTNEDYIKASIDTFATGVFYYKVGDTSQFGLPANTQWVFVCDEEDNPNYGMLSQEVSDSFDPILALSGQQQQVVTLLSDPSAKIGFANPIDRYALFGETCAGIVVPRSKVSGSQSQCTDFKSGDDVFANGVWDAPKVDPRVLQALLYLVTPVSQGGAGREFIRIKKLMQTNTTNKLDNPVVQSAPVASPSPSVGTALDPTLQASNISSSLDQNIYGSSTDGTTDTSTVVNNTLPSDNYLNPNDPPGDPINPIHSIYIDQIDKFRVSTKVVENRLLGNNTTTYKNQPPVPIDVSWQTDAGLSKDAPPDYSSLSMVESSRLLTNATVVQMLNNMGLGDMQIDVSKSEINDYNDVAHLIGQSLLEQLLGSPKGSMSGWNLGSNLQSIGLAFLEQNLGLVPGSLADTNPLDANNTTVDFSDVIGGIGRATLEYVLGFPAGALRTKTGDSADILESVGKSYLENNIFQVSPGTLTPSAGYPLNTVGDLLARLGEGRIEKVFKLPNQSLRKQYYQNDIASQSFRDSSFKASLLFPVLGKTSYNDQDYGMANYDAEQLSLTYVPYKSFDTNGVQIGSGNTSMYGFSQSDFATPVLSVSPNDPDSLEKFKQLVGSRAIETSLGLFQSAGGDDVYSTVDSRIPVSQKVNVDPGAYATQGPMIIDPQLQPIKNDDGTVCYDTTHTKLALFATDGHVYSEGVQKFLDSTKGLKRGTQAFTDAKKGIDPSITDYDGFIYMLELYQDPKDFAITYEPCTAQTDSNANGQIATLADSNILKQVGDVVFNTAPVDKLDFTNSDKQPKKADFADGWDVGARYRTALAIFYSNPANRATAPLNYFADKTTLDLTQMAQDIDPNADVVAPQVVANVLNTIANGGNLGGTSLPSDSDFRTRLNLIQSKMNQDKTNDIFNITKILNAGYTADLLDQQLTKSVNNILVVPDTGNVKEPANTFSTDYTNPAMNGWLFMLKDLKQRMDCKASGGIYSLAADKTTYTCNPGNGKATPSQDTVESINQAATFIDRLYVQMSDEANAIINAITTHNFTTPGQTSTNQNGFDIATDIKSLNRQIDKNGRLAYAAANQNTDIIKNLVSPNGTGVVSLSTPITGFFKRGPDDRSMLGEAGRAYAAKKFATDALSKTTFASMLKTDFAKDLTTNSDITNVFKNATAATKTVAVEQTSLLDKGLANGDFERIFELDEAGQVFDRIGKEQILRTIWRKTGAAAAIKDTAQYQQILTQFRKIEQDLSFYIQRVNQIQQKSAELQVELNKLGGEYSVLSTQLGKINTAPTTDVMSPTDGLTRAQQYEPLVNVIRKKAAATGQTGLQVAKLSYEILHLGEEMIAGRALPMDENVSSTYSTINSALVAGSQTKASTDCFSKEQLLTTFVGGGTLTTKFTQLTMKVGTCEVEQVFGMPAQSFYAWYNLGLQQFPASPHAILELKDENGMPISIDVGSYADFGTVGPDQQKFYAKQANGTFKPLVPIWNAGRYSVQSLDLATGIADKMQRDSGFQLDLTKVNAWLQDQTPDTINQLVAQGDRVLKLTLLAKLATMIPGIGDLIKQYGLTTNDLVAIMQGNEKPLISKVGGTYLDKALNLPQGTSADLLYPTCHDNTGRVAPCNDDPNKPGTNPDNIRTQKLAQMGLKKLGVLLPNFPASFDLTAGGNLTDNWGNAVISGALGLATNSFTGKITDGGTYLSVPFMSDCIALGIRCMNSTQTLMQAFGFSQTPTMRIMKNIDSSVQQVVSTIQNQDFAAGQSFATSFMKSTIDAILEKHFTTMTLSRVQNSDITGGFEYWADTTNPAAMAVNSQALAFDDQVEYAKAIQEIWDSTSTDYLTPDARKAVRTTILDSLSGVQLLDHTVKIINNLKQSDLSDPALQLPLNLNTNLSVEIAPGTSDLYASYIRYFQQKMHALDGQYNVGGQAFEHFVHGDTNATTISGKVGLAQTAGSVLGRKIDDWIANSGPTWLKQLNTAFGYITAEQCPMAGNPDFPPDGGIVPTPRNTGMGIGGFLTSTVAGENGCFDNLGKLNSSQLLFGTDANMKGLRNFLFDNFLAKTFSADLESEVGFRKGTFKRIVDDPKNARQIVVTEGVNMIANKVFGSTNSDDACLMSAKIGNNDCTQKVTNGILKQAFIAGFCSDFVKSQCSLQFNTTRSVAVFNTQVNKAEDKELNRIGDQYLGMALTRSDVEINDGDLRGIALLSIQYTANQLNKSLYHGDKNSKLEKFYRTYYTDIKIAAGMSPMDGFTQLDIYLARGTTFLATKVCTGAEDDPYSCDNGDSYNYDELHSAYVDQIAKEQGISTEQATKVANSNIIDARVGAVQNAERTRRNQSYQAIEYAMFDILAFSKDKNIPPNFSKRLLGASGSDRSMALVEYALSSLMNQHSDFGKFLRSVCGGQSQVSNCAQLFTGFATSIGHPSQMTAFFKSNSGFINLLDVGASGWFKKQFDIDLPAGTLTGLYVWGMNGFRSKDFNTTTCLGTTDPTTHACSGKVAVSIGRVLENYGEKFITDWADKQFGLKKGTAAKIVQVARLLLDQNKITNPAMLQANKLAISALVASIIVDYFSPELAQADKALGLPPGTSAILAGAALTYGIAIASNVAASAATAAAFGPAFFIALGFQVIFGVTGVTVQSVGTADGYYPFYSSFNRIGSGEAMKCIGKGGWTAGSLGGCKGDAPHEQVTTRNEQIGTFDPTFSPNYKAGLKKAAQEKVRTLLIDLMLMPRDWAPKIGVDGKNLWIGQIETYGGIGASYDPTLNPVVSALIHRNDPFDPNSPDFGYGSTQADCSSTAPDSLTNSTICTRNQNKRTGVFGDTTLPDSVYLLFNTPLTTN